MKQSPTEIPFLWTTLCWLLATPVYNRQRAPISLLRCLAVLSTHPVAHAYSHHLLSQVPDLLRPQHLRGVEFPLTSRGRALQRTQDDNFDRLFHGPQDTMHRYRLNQTEGVALTAPHGKQPNSPASPPAVAPSYAQKPVALNPDAEDLGTDDASCMSQQEPDS